MICLKLPYILPSIHENRITVSINYCIYTYIYITISSTYIHYQYVMSMDFFKYSLQYITILSQYWIMTTVHISYIYILFFSPCYHHISPSGKAGSEYFPRQTGNNKRVIQWWLTGWGPNSLTKLANRTIIIIVYDTQITIFG
jgi:hypothetical protein